MIIKMLKGPVLIICFSAFGFSQASNTVFGEMGGSALLWSFNYDRMVTDKISVRAGFGSFTFGSDISSDMGGEVESKIAIKMFPITVNYLLGKNNHKIEVGAGMTLFSVEGEFDLAGLSMSSEGSLFIPAGVLAYRYQRSNGGLFFRIGVAPLFIGEEVSPETPFAAMPGVSIGYTF